MFEIVWYVMSHRLLCHTGSRRQRCSALYIPIKGNTDIFHATDHTPSFFIKSDRVNDIIVKNGAHNVDFTPNEFHNPATTWR